MEGKEVVKTPSSNKVLSSLSPHLFWDMDILKADMDTCPAQIIQRVLEYGTLDDWRIIYRYYGLDKIVSTCKSRLRRYLMGIKKINQKKFITFVVWNSPSYYY
jgi:serine protease inhibitor ecotin